MEPTESRVWEVQASIAEIQRGLVQMPEAKQDELEQLCDRLVKEMAADGLLLCQQFLAIAVLGSTLALIMRKEQGMPLSLCCSIIASMMMNIATGTAEEEDAMIQQGNTLPI